MMPDEIGSGLLSCGVAVLRVVMACAGYPTADRAADNTNREIHHDKQKHKQDDRSGDANEQRHKLVATATTSHPRR